MKHTPGPWMWWMLGGAPILATPDRGRLIVMDFVRKGMNSAQPRFATWEGEARERLGGIMRPIESMPELDSHPDARLIAAAPELLQALKDLLRLVEVEELVPESVSYMKQARDAVARAEPVPKAHIPH